MTVERMATPGGAVHGQASGIRPSAGVWLFRPMVRPDAIMRLFCFPYAGVGAAVYRAWPGHLPQGVEVCAVQPPGREGRLREAPLTSFRDLVDAAVGGLRAYFDRPFALFGHSMGALLAFEVARALVARGEVPPVHLFVSGRRAPHLPAPHAAITHLGHDAFVAEVRRRYDGIPEEVLRNPDLMELLVPTLRADMMALEGYTHVAGAPLECPITAYGGSDDPEATEPEIAAWAPYSRAAFRYRILPGNHFFIQASRAAVAGEVGKTLERQLQASTNSCGGVDADSGERRRVTR
jgi:medium-chain acyl-[acyl-carrier-protein] hydrolase